MLSLKSQITIYAIFLAGICQLATCTVKEIIRKFILQPVFTVHHRHSDSSCGRSHIIDLSLKGFSKPFCAGSIGAIMA